MDKKMKSEIRKRNVEKRLLNNALFLNFIGFALTILRLDLNTWFGIFMLLLTVCATAVCSIKLDFDKRYNDHGGYDTTSFNGCWN